MLPIRTLKLSHFPSVDFLKVFTWEAARVALETAECVYMVFCKHN